MDVLKNRPRITLILAPRPLYNGLGFRNLNAFLGLVGRDGDKIEFCRVGGILA